MIHRDHAEALVALHMPREQAMGKFEAVTLVHRVCGTSPLRSDPAN